MEEKNHCNIEIMLDTDCKIMHRNMKWIMEIIVPLPIYCIHVKIYLQHYFVSETPSNR